MGVIHCELLSILLHSSLQLGIDNIRIAPSEGSLLKTNECHAHFAAPYQGHEPPTDGALP